MTLIFGKGELLIQKDRDGDAIDLSHLAEIKEHKHYAKHQTIETVTKQPFLKKMTDKLFSPIRASSKEKPKSNVKEA